MTSSSVTETSRDAYDQAISSGRTAALTDAIFKAVERAHRNGIKDMSGREIKEAIRDEFPRADCSDISGRVRELVRAKRLAKNKDQKRPCTITGFSIGPVSIPRIQDRIGL
jgi:hypothetical protein